MIKADIIDYYKLFVRLRKDTLASLCKGMKFLKSSN